MDCANQYNSTIKFSIFWNRPTTVTALYWLTALCRWWRTDPHQTRADRTCAWRWPRCNAMGWGAIRYLCWYNVERTMEKRAIWNNASGEPSSKNRNLKSTWDHLYHRIDCKHHLDTEPIPTSQLSSRPPSPRRWQTRQAFFPLFSPSASWPLSSPLSSWPWHWLRRLSWPGMTPAVHERVYNIATSSMALNGMCRPWVLSDVLGVNRCLVKL